MKVRVRPSKATSLIGMTAGLAMIVVALVFFFPRFGMFAVAWTIVALIIVAYHAFNAFSTRGVASQEIDVEAFDPRAVQPDDISDRLNRLDSLRTKGLISEQEYQTKRNEIIEQL